MSDKKETESAKKEEKKTPELVRMDQFGWAILITGLGLLILLPILFTRPWGLLILNTNEMSNIGSSISGMTAPALGILSAGLVFLSFRAQIRMNDRQILQFDRQDQRIEEQERRLEKLEEKKIIDKLTDIAIQNSKIFHEYCKGSNFNNIHHVLTRSNLTPGNKISTIKKNLKDFYDQIRTSNSLLYPLFQISNFYELDRNERLLIYAMDTAGWETLKEDLEKIIKVFAEMEKLKINQELLEIMVGKIEYKEYVEMLYKFDNL